MADIEKIPTEPPSKPDGFFGRRHLQFLMMFAALILAYGMRTNMSVGIIAMMEKHPPDPSIPTFPEWTQKQTILSAFFWGYVVPQIGAGQLGKMFGPKWFLVATMAINSIFCILTPILAQAIGEGGVILCRVLQGLSQGFLLPSTHTLLGKWTPLAERSRIVSFIYTGGPLGTVIAMPLTGLISESNVGWPIAFYLYGSVGIAWAIMWAFLGLDSPQQDKSISAEELKYIEGDTIAEKYGHIVTPWKQIWTSWAVWAVVLAHFGQNWGFWTLQTEIPSYMKAKKFDIATNSSLSALPYLALWLMNFIFSPLADFLIVRKYLTIARTRILMNSIGMIIPAVTLIGLGFYEGSQQELVVTLLVIAVGFNSATYSGFNVNHIDLSPTHAGTLMGITNCAGTIAAIMAPLIVPVIGLKEENPILWRIIFCVSAAVNFATNTFFVAFVSGEVQPWNDNTSSDKEGAPRKASEVEKSL